MSNNDNAMTRFLFAILRQKNLKDIDWNKVARDPILTQEITNGHAARMRYSRFRSAMLGLEPQRRNRTSKEKPNRVTKSKKDPKSDKEKSFTTAVTADPNTMVDSSEPPLLKIKQENTQHNYDHRLTPGSLPPTPNTAMPHVIQPRLLTPCSDTDVYSTSQGLASTSTNELIHGHPSFDFPVPHYSHDPVGWQHGSMFPPYDAHYELDGYGIHCSHQHIHHHNEIPAGPSDPEGDHVNVKLENWAGHHV